MTQESWSPAALVTGGAKRIGRAVSLALAAHGMRVAVHANTSAAEANAVADSIQSDGGQAVALLADLSNEQAARGLVDQAHRVFGRLDVLVNSAAIWRPKRLEEVTAEDLLEYYRVNTVSSFICGQHAGLLMSRQECGGAIVNLGDWADAHDGRPYPDYSAYHPSKGAVVAMTRSLAVELAQRNGRVRVNAVLPGPVLASPGETPAETPETLQGNLLSDPGTAQDVAAAVLFLATSPFITGVCLPVDGGRRLAGAERLQNRSAD